MQYDIDINGEFAEIFKKIKAILLSYPQIKELKNAKQTSYSDEYGVIIMMRGKGDVFVVAFGKGAQLQESFSSLQGDGKIVRHLYFKSVDEVDEKIVFEIGGKSKDAKQIADIDNAYLAIDDIESGYDNVIPLWLFGFLY